MSLSRISSQSIADGTVVAADIANASVTSAKIANTSITTEKVALSIQLTSPTVNSGFVVESTVRSLFEKANVQAAAASASLNYNLLDQSVMFFTDNATANVSVNFTGNDTTTLNSILGGESNTISSALLITNGATSYYVNNVQIDGTVIYDATISGNLFWLGNTVVVPGNPEAIDAYSFTIIKKADASFTVLASQSEYKSFL